MPQTRRPAASRTTKDVPQSRQSRRTQLHEAKLKHAKVRRLRRWLAVVGAAIVVALIGYGLWSAAPTGGDTATTAPDFTLSTTAGGTVTLSALRGKPVILYFNEGAGCGSCTQQMAEIEKNPGFAEAGITVLPIVMNTAEQILPDMQVFGVTTPYLLDDGKVSAAYDVLGKGMHEGLPGHGFVLIDARGTQRWYGNYPSMWLDPNDLLKEVTARL
ncbi:MAG: peroxiredoxin family protein [Propionicimonas sp.]